MPMNRASFEAGFNFRKIDPVALKSRDDLAIGSRMRVDQFGVPTQRLGRGDVLRRVIEKENLIATLVYAAFELSIDRRIGLQQAEFVRSKPGTEASERRIVVHLGPVIGVRV